MGEGARAYEQSTSGLYTCMIMILNGRRAKHQTEGDRQQQLGTAGFGDTLYEGSHAM